MPIYLNDKLTKLKLSVLDININAHSLIVGVWIFMYLHKLNATLTDSI